MNIFYAEIEWNVILVQIAKNWPNSACLESLNYNKFLDDLTAAHWKVRHLGEIVLDASNEIIDDESSSGYSSVGVCRK